MPVQWLLAAGLILVLDQVTKKLALGRAGRGPGSPARSGSGPRIRAVDNAGIGFGLIRDRRALVLLWSFALLGTILLIQQTAFFRGLAPQIGLGVALGGATSNLLDKLRRGAVIDFIDLRLWPVFNLADVAIVCGVVIALWSVR
jgi:signal peptidase II